MSDFSELCPLFNTGVFNEVTFPIMYMSAVIPSANLLNGTVTATGSQVGGFTFGRTVIVTNAFIKRVIATNTTNVDLWLGRRTSVDAVATVFGSVSLPLSGSQYEVGYSWHPFVLEAPKTFTSTDVLSLGIASALTVCSGAVELMIRYKEK